MPNPQRGEVWIVDLGMIGKTRPCLVFSIPLHAQDRALITVVQHTTSTRGTRFEIVINASFLRRGAVDAQGMATVSQAKFLRRIESLSPPQMAQVETVVRTWLGL